MLCKDAGVKAYSKSLSRTDNVLLDHLENSTEIEILFLILTTY
jgi:hypothetical protein